MTYGAPMAYGVHVTMPQFQVMQKEYVEQVNVSMHNGPVTFSSWVETETYVPPTTQSVNDRLQKLEKRLQRVDDRLQRVDDRLQGVDDRLKRADDDPLSRSARRSPRSSSRRFRYKSGEEEEEF